MSVVTCPACRAQATVPDTIPPGQSVSCPSCRRPLPVIAAVPVQAPGPRPPYRRGGVAGGFWIVMLVLNSLVMIGAFIASVDARRENAAVFTAPVWAAAWMIFAYTAVRAIENIERR